MKISVLFLCTHNSARSQMAEGLLNHLFGDIYQAYSAGTEPGRVHPLAVKVMQEIGIDISHHSSKSLEEFMGANIGVVVTVCDNAKESCPFFPGARKYVHKSFPDPSGAEGSEEERTEEFRRIRDEIRAWLQDIGAEMS